MSRESIALAPSKVSWEDALPLHRFIDYAFETDKINRQS